MAKQGKCEKDQRRYLWNEEMRICLVYCPMCGNQLEKTSRSSKLESWFGELESVPKGYTLKNLVRSTGVET